MLFENLNYHGNLNLTPPRTLMPAPPLLHYATDQIYVRGSAARFVAAEAYLRGLLKKRMRRSSIVGIRGRPATAAKHWRVGLRVRVRV